MMFKRLGVIGCGLIGCSFAMAARKAGIVERIVGYSKSPTTTENAKAAGILDETAPSALQAVSGSDLVFIAVPVGAMPKIFQDIVSLITPEMLIMDAGSTKQDVILAAQEIFRKKIVNFVPAHPVAGKATAGFRASEADLFSGHKVVLTPLEITPQAQLDNAIKVWEAIGSKVHLMSAKEHDAAFAAISHMPHLLAFAYMKDLITQIDGERNMTLAGTGFRDFTRIASGEPHMWRDIFIANKEEMLFQIATFKRVLIDFERAIDAENEKALLNLIHSASAARTGWSLGERPVVVASADQGDDDGADMADEADSSEDKPGIFRRIRNAWSSKPTKE